MTAASPRKERRLEEFFRTQMTTGARYGLIVLAVLFGLFGLRQLSASVDTLKASAENTASELRMLSDETTEAVWQERASDTEAIAASWDRQMLSAASPGVGAAQLEVQLREIAARSRVGNLQISISPDLIERNDIDVLRFDLTGQLLPGDLYALIAEFAGSRPALIVTDLQVATRTDSGVTLKVSGICPFRQAGAAP